MGRVGSGRSRVARAATRRRSGFVLRAVRPVVQRLAHEHGLVVWDLEFVRTAGDEVVRVAVDRAGGVDSSGISAFSEALSRALDEQDAVPGEARYVLEVTSPGAERRLRTPDEFQICRGRPARLTFRSGREPIEGRIVDATEESVRLELSTGDRLDVKYEQISQARLTVSGV